MFGFKLVARSLQAVAGPLSALVLASTAGPALAVSTFTETFDTNTSNWLNAVSAAPTYNATGGVANSGYISYLSPDFTSGGTGPFGAPPLTILFRGNNAANASGDAFVGNWIADGVQTLSVAVRHNYGSTLSLYARLDAGAGAAASLTPTFVIPSNTWTTITIPITNSNPPFLSYGAGNFNSVFSNVQNVQLGLYVPANTFMDDLRFDIDDVTVSTVPEPTSLSLIGLGLGLLALRRRPRRG